MNVHKVFLSLFAIVAIVFSTVPTPVGARTFADLEVFSNIPSSLIIGSSTAFEVVFRNNGPGDVSRARGVFGTRLDFHAIGNLPEYCSIRRRKRNRLVCYFNELKEGQEVRIPLSVTPSTFLSCSDRRVVSERIKGKTKDPDTTNNSRNKIITFICDTAPKLFITQLDTGGERTVERGDRNVSLLKFTAHAEGADLRMTQLKFAPRDGSAMAARHFSLWEDTDGDGVADQLVQNISSFGNPELLYNLGGNYIIPRDTSVTFELRADIKETRISDRLQFEFRSFVDRYVEAERASDNADLWGIKTNGSCISTCNIIVNTGPAVLIHINQ